MGDVFKEQIVKRKSGAKEIVMKICLVVLVLFVGFFLLAFPVIPPPLNILVVFALVFGARYLMSYLSVEYEYVFTNGELDIDVIYDQSRRKRLFTASANSFEIMAHIEDRAHDHTITMAQATLDYSTGEITPNTYVFLVTHNSKKTKVIIEPNDKMLKAISSAVPRRSFHLKPGAVLLP